MPTNHFLQKSSKKELIKMINDKDNEILKLKIFENDLSTKASYSVDEYNQMCDEKILEYLQLQKKYDTLANQSAKTEKLLKKHITDNNLLLKEKCDLEEKLQNPKTLSQLDTNKLMKQTKKNLITEIETLRNMIH